MSQSCQEAEPISVMSHLSTRIVIVIAAAVAIAPVLVFLPCGAISLGSTILSRAVPIA